MFPVVVVSFKRLSLYYLKKAFLDHAAPASALPTEVNFGYLVLLSFILTTYSSREAGLNLKQFFNVGEPKPLSRSLRLNTVLPFDVSDLADANIDKL